MGDPAKQNAIRGAKRAQERYLRFKDKLDQAGEDRRESFAQAKAAGLSLAEIGEAAGLHRSRVEQILKGK